MTHEGEERLAGGNVAGAVRVGDTVRRPTGAWSPTGSRWRRPRATRVWRIYPPSANTDRSRTALTGLVERIPAMSLALG